MDIESLAALLLGKEIEKIDVEFLAALILGKGIRMIAADTDSVKLVESAKSWQPTLTIEVARQQFVVRLEPVG